MMARDEVEKMLRDAAEKYYPSDPDEVDKAPPVSLTEMLFLLLETVELHRTETRETLNRIEVKVNDISARIGFR